jgi:pimeloyl-ACP methyl ester carboxylesterase
MAAEAASGAYASEHGGLLGSLGIKYSPRGGFQAALTRNADGLYVLAFAGTDPSSIANWAANTSQAVGMGSAQYDQGIRIAQDVWSATGGNVLFVGHSLGGGIASAAAYATVGRAITFNAAGLHSSYRVATPGAIRAHYLRGEIPTVLQRWTPLPNAVGLPIPHSAPWTQQPAATAFHVELPRRRLKTMRIYRVILAACLMLASLSTCAMDPRQRALSALDGMRAEQYFANPVQAKFVTAIGKGDLEGAKRWLDQAAEVNAVGNEGLTPLIWALIKQRLTSVEFLLREGADPNQITRWKSERGPEQWASPLELAAQFEDGLYLKALLANGANPNLVVSAAGDTAISTASLHRRLQNMELLIASGANVNHRSQFGYTPILDSVGWKAFRAALLLLENGADPTLETVRGFSAITTLEQFENRGVVIGSDDEKAYPELIAELKRRGYLQD